MRPLFILPIIFTLLVSFSATVVPAWAAAPCQTDTNGVCLLQPDIVEGQTQESSLGHYLSLLFKTLIGLAGGISVLIIVVSGLQYILSEVPGIKTSAKNRISEALIGLILALAAYLILYTINPDLVNLNLQVESVSSKK